MNISRTSSKEVYYPHYLQVSVPVVTPAQCADSMGPREDGQICAGGSSGRDACQAWMYLSLENSLRK